MTSKVGIRVKLKNLQTMREQLGTTGTNHLLQRIETFLQRRLRGTDQLERPELGEFRLSILNADSDCIPALQRRFSASVLQAQFSNTGACDPNFYVETETMTLPSTLGGDGIGEGRYPMARHTAFRR